jgi:ParB family chromosome partitioning protein
MTEVETKCYSLPDACGLLRTVSDLGGRGMSESDPLEGTTQMQNASARCIHAPALEQVERRAARSCRGRGSESGLGFTSATFDPVAHPPALTEESALSIDALSADGIPLRLHVEAIEEDPDNPRTEFPDEEIAELARDIALRGILQPIVARPAAETGRYRVLFGAKRLRAARKAGLQVVPVVIGSPAHDAYAQVAENQKRHGLTPLDLARFIRARIDAGESNAEIARRLGMDLTSVAHHLALLSLPPQLDEAFRSGRCTSPRTLYELAKLQKTKPEQVKALAGREGEITRGAVAALKKASRRPPNKQRNAVERRRTSLASQADGLCARLESILARMTRQGAQVTSDELASVRRRLALLASMAEGRNSGPIAP